MERLRKRLATGLMVIAALAVSGVALGAEGDDTVLNYGYDEGSHFFIWNVTSLDYLPDDGQLDETLEGYEDSQLEALLAACGLQGDDPESPDQYTYTFDPATGLITVTLEGEPEGGEAEEIVCGDFSGGDVTGPAGQVNHGMFLKFFNANYEGANRGCIVRHIAGSGLGKGDQQVMAGDAAEPDDEEVTEVTEGSITFTTVTTDCQHGKGDTEEDGDEPKGNGPPQHVIDKFGGQHPRDVKGKPAPNGLP